MKTWSPLAVRCNGQEGHEITTCRPAVNDCLFELEQDPCELNNLADSHFSILEQLKKRIVEYNATYYPPQIQPFDPLSHPDLHNGLWVPWKDPYEVMDSQMK